MLAEIPERVHGVAHQGAPPLMSVQVGNATEVGRQGVRHDPERSWKAAQDGTVVGVVQVVEPHADMQTSSAGTQAMGTSRS